MYIDIFQKPKTPRRKSSSKCKKDDSIVLTEKSFNKTPRASFNRRKSIELIRNARRVIQNHPIRRQRGYIGDRFIGHRGAMNFNKLDDEFDDQMNWNQSYDHTDRSGNTDNLVDKVVLKNRNRMIKHNMNQKSPSMGDRLQSFLKVRKLKRKGSLFECSSKPERKLDSCIEELTGDEVICVDWSCKGFLAIVLDSLVVLWHEINKCSIILCSIDDDSDNSYNIDDSNDKSFYSVKWLDNNYGKNMLAVGTSYGEIDIWEIGDMVVTVENNESYIYCQRKIVRKLNVTYTDVEHDKRIRAMSYCNKILTVGTAIGKMEHHDTNLIKTLIGCTEFHQQEIWKMEPSPNSKYLAVASCDGSVSIWLYNCLQSKPVAHFVENGCGINAISWNPKNPNHLAITTGDENNKIKIFDMETKTNIRSVTTKSEITFLYWSNLKRMLVALTCDESISKFTFYDEEYLDKEKEISETAKFMCMGNSASGERMATVDNEGIIYIWKFFSIPKRRKSYLEEMSRFR